MYTTTLQFTKFQNINTNGENEKDGISYGYRLYNVYESNWCNTYDDFKDLLLDIDDENVVDFIMENHNEFYDTIVEEGGLEFNGHYINLNGEEIDEDDEDPTLLPDNSELPNGEPKYVINIDKEEMKEVDKIIVEASKDLI